jgi:hypothetical protein
MPFSPSILRKLVKEATVIIKNRIMIFWLPEKILRMRSREKSITTALSRKFFNFYTALFSKCFPASNPIPITITPNRS